MQRKPAINAIATVFWILCLILPAVHDQDTCNVVYGSGSTTLRPATGSPGEPGLVEVLANLNRPGTG